MPSLVLVSRCRLFVLGSSLIELGLRQLHDRPKAEIVSSLRKVEGIGGLSQQLIS